MPRLTATTFEILRNNITFDKIKIKIEIREKAKFAIKKNQERNEVFESTIQTTTVRMAYGKN